MITIFVGILVAVLFILPFILLGIKKNKGGKHLKEALSKIAKENKCLITISEYLADSAIGLDEKANHLFFVHTFNGKETFQHLILSDYHHCEAKNISRNVKNSKGNFKAIDKIKLAFIPINQNKPIVDLDFFNSDENTNISDEIMVIEKWEKTINKRMKMHT
ncbi:MAG: hypothetical protein KGZ97_05865 [Bacteroidetes bacterium]|nr:hypothetical protein [Bacteroidota bacterium]